MADRAVRSTPLPVLAAASKTCQSAKPTQSRTSPAQTSLRISSIPPDILVLEIKKEEASAKTRGFPH
jgi:hypothetical protein